MRVLEKNKRYTYQDYCQWGDEIWELIDGIPFDNSSGQPTRHQLIRGYIGVEIHNALEKRNSVIFMSPVDVVLTDYDVVQPDILVVCDPKKITKKNIQGAPDLIIEILSPSTSKRDRWTKKQLYERNGVKEYIIVDGEGAFSEQYILQKNGKFQEAVVIDFDEPLQIKTAENLALILKEALDIPPFNQE